MNAAASPRESTSSTAAASSMSAISTLAPSSTKTWAIARPMPLAPPVTIATFPSSSHPIGTWLHPFVPLRAGFADAVDHGRSHVDGFRLSPHLDGVGDEREGVEHLEQSC